MFTKYYQAELAYLRELGAEFARAHPATAGLLSERSGDPDVERLLEGVAFLTAQLKERVDDAAPALVHALCELLLPHALRQTPAAAIAEFKPRRPPKERLLLARGAQLASKPVSGVRCLFRTCADLELLPLTVARVELDEVSANKRRLTLGFESHLAATNAVFHRNGIRLFLHGSLPLASQLFAWMVHHCRAARLRSTRRRATRPLDPAWIRPAGFGQEAALVDWPKFAPPGVRVLQEYLALPEKLLFVDICELDQVADIVSDRFEIELDIDDAPPLPTRLAPSNFRVNCAPIVNIFEAEAEPLRRDLLARDQLLRPASFDPRHVEVLSINKVVGIPAGGGPRRIYGPFASFEHEGDSAFGGFYELRRARSPLDGAIDCHLGISEARDASPQLEGETLSISLNCTNRDLPAELGIGDISQPSARTKSLVTFSNITPVSKPARPPLGGALQWRLLVHLAASQRSLADAGALRSMLGLYNNHSESDVQKGRANQRRLDAIREVRMELANRMLGGAPVRGMQAHIRVDESGLAGPGDAYLLGCVLDEMLASRVPINSFNQLILRLHPSQLVLRWPPRNGDQHLL